MLVYSTADIIISLLFGLIFYVTLEISLHYLCKNKTTKIERKTHCLAFISIGYFIKDCYKGNSKNVVRGRFIKTCNFWNCIVSIVLLIISLVVAFAKPDYLICLVGFNFWRFYSRNLEIILAFGFDVFNKGHSRTGNYFDKFDRLKLAVVSYFEIYFYSASFYVTVIQDGGLSLILKSLLMSISVGTLTNVAYSKENLGDSSLQLLPFIQVLAVLSLVVLV